MVSVTYLPNADNICVPGCSWSSFPGDPGIYERLFPSLILFDDFFFFFSCSLSNTQLGQGRCRAPPWDGTSCGSDGRVTVFKTSSREGSGQLLLRARSLPAAPSPPSPPVSLLPPAAVLGSCRRAGGAPRLASARGSHPEHGSREMRGSSRVHLPGHGGSCWARG